MKKLKIIAVIIGSLSIADSFAQDSLSVPFYGKDTVPINYFCERSNYPYKLTISGKVIAVTTSTSCGVFQSSGTFKILIYSSNKEFQDEIIYVVYPCLANKNKYLGKDINVRLIGLKESNKECIHPIFNSFNSGETPFYWIKDSNRRENIFNSNK